MADGKGALLGLQGKVNGSNALVVVADAGSAVGGNAIALSSCQGKVDASNRLVVVMV